jgi:hypothetical protein
MNLDELAARCRARPDDPIHMCRVDVNLGGDELVEVVVTEIGGRLTFTMPDGAAAAKQYPREWPRGTIMSDFLTMLDADLVDEDFAGEGAVELRELLRRRAGPALDHDRSA